MRRGRNPPRRRGVRARSASPASRREAGSVPLAIQRSLAHTCYHVGQIILIARILAGDHWTTITIPRGASASFNQRIWGKPSYSPHKPDA